MNRISRLASRFPSPEQSPGFMLWHLTHAWQRTVRAALTPYDLTHVQFVLLAALAANEKPLTQRQLAESASTDPMMTSQVVRALEVRGLLERHPHPHDGRAFLLAPTSAGTDLINDANRAVEEADGTFFAGLGSTGIRQLIDLLATLRRFHRRPR